MQAKKFMQRLLPPVAIDFIKNNLGYIGLAPWKYVPEGFDYKINSKGWDMAEIAKLQHDKWDDYVKIIKGVSPLGINHESSNSNEYVDPFFHNLLISFAYVLTLSGIKKQKINFLDWGGGIGHYGLLAEELVKPAGLEVNYFCYDFEVFGDSGKKLNPQFNFFSDGDKYLSQPFDLIVASSSIWYEKEWKHGVDKLCAHDTEYLYITRMIFIEDKPSYVALQQPSYMGYKTEYLFWVINKNEFLNYVLEKGYALIKQFEFGNVTPVFKAPEQGTMKGFLFKKCN